MGAVVKAVVLSLLLGLAALWARWILWEMEQENRAAWWTVFILLTITGADMVLRMVMLWGRR